MNPRLALPLSLLTNPLTFFCGQIGQLTAFGAYQFNVIFGFGRIISSVTQLASASGGASRIFQILDRDTEMPLSGRDVPSTPVRGDVYFQDVGFAYPMRPDNQVLTNFSLSIAADSTTALVGSSGCGKSTILALLLRFYDVQSGAVTIDGLDVRSVDAKWLRTRMAFVQQEPVLFGLTIQENVEYALRAREATWSDPQTPAATGISIGVTASPSNSNSPGTGTGGPGTGPGSGTGVVITIDEQAAAQEKALARVKAACAKANAADFVEGFTDGYATLVGERGVRLSGGQKQRIAIARALLAEPRILLLDEATSALDSESERLVQDAIDRVSAGRTVVIVAHRLSTVQDADQIAVVEFGAVVDAGKHTELLGRCNAYQNLVKRQMG